MHLFHKLSFLIFLFANLSFSQNLLPNQLSVKDGLSSNTIHEVFIDKNLNTWIATSANTYIYKNGNIFPFFFNQNENIQNCVDIFQDPNNAIWFGTHGKGLYRYDGKTLRHYDESKGLISNNVKKIYYKDDLIYVATQNGISILNPETGEIKNPNVSRFKKLLEFTILDFIEINNQIYFITRTDGLFKIVNDKSNPRVIKIRNHNYINSIFLWNNRIYTAHRNYLNVYNISDYINNKAEINKIPIPNVSGFTVNHNRLVTVSYSLNINEGRIYVLNEDNTYYEFKNLPNLSSKSFNGIIINRAINQCYISTDSDGVLIYDLNVYKDYFKTEYKTVTDIQPFKSDYIVVTENSLELKSLSDNLLANFDANDLIDKLPQDASFETKIQFKQVTTTTDSVYLNTNIGKFVLDKKMKSAKFITSDDNPLLIHQDNIYKFDKYNSTNIANEFLGNNYAQNPNQLPTLLYQALSFRNKIVVSTRSNGLFEIQNNEVKSLINSGEFKNSRIKIIKKTIDENLIVVTEFDGVYELNPNFKYKEKLHIKTDKLIGKNIFYVDTYQGFYVIGTEAGIEFLKNDQHFVLNVDYGLNLENFICANIIGDYIYIGGNNGYYKFSIPDFLKYKNIVRGVFVGAIYSSSDEGTLKNIDWINGLKTDQLVLKNDAPLTINFLPITSNNSSLLFRYRLSPESNWSEYSKKSSIQILKLDEENLNFEVEFFDKISQTSQSFQLLNISVAKNYSLLYILTLLLILIGIAVFYLYIVAKKTLDFFSLYVANFDQDLLNEANLNKSVIKDNESIQELILLANKNDNGSLEKKLMLNAINSHFIFNVFNYLQYNILEKNEKLAVNYSNDFAKFFRSYLKNAQKSLISLENEIEFLKAYINLEEKRFNYNLNFQILNDDYLDFSDIYIPAFSLYPILETILNYAFTEETENVLIKLDFKDFDDDSILVSYYYNGLSLEEVYNQSKNRINAKMKLLKECLDYNNREILDLIFETTHNDLQKCTIRIYV